MQNTLAWLKKKKIRQKYIGHDWEWKDTWLEIQRQKIIKHETLSSTIWRRESYLVAQKTKVNRRSRPLK